MKLLLCVLWLSGLEGRPSDLLLGLEDLKLEGVLAKENNGNDGKDILDVYSSHLK